MKSCKEVTLNCYWFGNCVRHTIFAAAKEGDALFKPLRTQFLIIIWGALPWKVSLSFRHCQPSRRIVLRIAAGISLTFCLKHAVLNVTTTCLHSFIHRYVYLSSQPTIPPSFHRFSNRTSKTIRIGCHRHRFHPWPSNSTTSRRATCWLDFFGGVMVKNGSLKEMTTSNPQKTTAIIRRFSNFFLFEERERHMGPPPVRGWNYNTHVFPAKVALIHACLSSKNRWTWNCMDIPKHGGKVLIPFSMTWEKFLSQIHNHSTPTGVASMLFRKWKLQNSCLRSLFVIPTVNQMMGLTCFKKSLLHLKLYCRCWRWSCGLKFWDRNVVRKKLGLFSQ